MLGNAHLEHDPKKDFIKFAQACFLIEKAAKYVRENSSGATEQMPFICGGDFNSFPVSSVLSAFYAEDIEGKDLSNDKGSTWSI